MIGLLRVLTSRSRRLYRLLTFGDQSEPMTDALATRIGSSYRATRVCLLVMTVLGLLA